MPPTQTIVVSIELLCPVDFERGIYRITAKSKDGQILGVKFVYGLLDIERYAN